MAVKLPNITGRASVAERKAINSYVPFILAFNKNPYPFGTVPGVRTGGITSGGRNGDATLPPDTSARIPAYVLP